MKSLSAFRDRQKSDSLFDLRYQYLLRVPDISYRWCNPLYLTPYLIKQFWIFFYTKDTIHPFEFRFFWIIYAKKYDTSISISHCDYCLYHFSYQLVPAKSLKLNGLCFFRYFEYFFYSVIFHDIYFTLF